jgi:CHAT domain-containing protein
VANPTGKAVPAPGVISHPIGQRRRRIAHPGVSLVVAVAALCARHPAVTTGLAAALRGQDTTPLERGVAIEGDLSTGESHTYRLSLTTGDFIRITVEQKGIDVAATLVRPDGRDLVAVDASSNDFRPETIVAIADISGTYTIHGRPAPSAGPHGHYAIRVDELRAAAPPDDVRIEAERAFERGRTWMRTQPPGYREALGELSRALDRYRQVGDHHGELKADLEVGVTQSALFLPEALVSARRVERVARELQDEPARAVALRLLGFESARAGDLAAALRAFEVLRTRATNREVEAFLLNNLGIAYQALGKEIKGEGLVGLTRAFIYAGAPRVVASLWEVSDLATAELMKAFYRGMLQEHLPPAAALRAAQLQLSQDSRWASPYFWAGFVLQGQWQ